MEGKGREGRGEDIGEKVTKSWLTLEELKETSEKILRH